jgi:hypothetical protein
MMRPLRLLLIIGFFMALAVLKTYPLTAVLGTHIPGDLLDPLFNTWALAWGVHALLTQPLRLFDANIFHPIPGALAFGEHMLGLLPVFAPIYLATGSALVAHNVLFMLTFALAGLAAFCLAFRWTQRTGPALVAGVLFGFAPYRFAQITHIMILGFFWAPLVMVFLDRFLHDRRWRNLIGFAIFYWLQALSSVYLAFMVTIAVVLQVAYYSVFIDGTILRGQSAAKVGAFMVASVAILGPIHRPYMAFQTRWHMVRSIRDAEAGDLMALLSAPPLVNDLYAGSLHFSGYWENWLFPGLVLPALIALGSRGSVTGLAPETLHRLRVVSWITIGAGLLLSLGPRLIAFGYRTAVPLPYLALYYIVPGWSGMRNPQRFVLLALLGAIPLLALGSLWLSQRLEPRLGRLAAPLVAGVLIWAFLIELGAKPLPVAEVLQGEAPPVYGWLARERPGPIAEVPFGHPPAPFEDAWYMYMSTSHWLPLVNGYSSYAPPTYFETAEALGELPAARAVAYAAALGTRAIVVHEATLTPHQREHWAPEIVASGGLRLISKFGTDVVYGVPPIETTRGLHTKLSIPAQLALRDEVKLGLLLQPVDDKPWTHPAPHGRSGAVVTFTDVKTGQAWTITTTVQLPHVILPSDIAAVPITLKRPAMRGHFTVQVALPSRGMATESRSVELTTVASPTSADAPGRLAARYAVSSAVPTVVTTPGWVSISIAAINIGDPVWVARARHNRGEVKLAWRWLRAGREVPDTGGRLPVRYDVFTGQSHPFRLTAELPADPGRYVLEAGLISEGLRAFSDNGSSPLRFDLDVHPH